MRSLYQLAVRFNSDKLYFHSYIAFYQKLFEGMEVKRLLEIGIGFEDLMGPLVPHYTHGSSLYMWEAYFPQAQIFACDIRPDTMVHSERIQTRVCDQSKREDVERLVEWSGGNFDVVIDDGSHIHEHQLLTAQVLLPHVRKGGAYIVEDVWPDKGTELANAIGGELWQGSKRGDDNLVVVRT